MYELKKSKKYSTNIRHRRKRRSYIRKNSMKNKILYGGSVYTITFESKGLTYELIKDIPSLNFTYGDGKYKLRHVNKSDTTEIVEETDLSNFIGQLISLPNSDIPYVLYKELTKEYERKDAFFNFKSLYDKLCYYILQIVDIVHNKITIADFKQLLSNTIGAKYISELLLIEETNIVKLKNIYDTIKKIRDLPSLVNIYRDIPLFKINYDLPTLYNDLREKDDVFPLGEGGFGTVYKVEIDGKEYALKVITKEHSIKNIPSIMNGEVIAYNTISQLVCDNDNKSFCKFISTYLDFSTNYIYILMEYCGISLQNTIIKGNSEITTLHIYNWLLHIAEGLQCMHKNKYAHLDIKPDNIVIGENLISKLIDFGLIFNFSSHNYSSKFNRVGTRDFMSPEMINKTVSSFEKCDVYSLGITFLECAFAFHYHNNYIHCFNTDASLSLLTSLLRYIPSVIELESPSQIPDELTLSPPVTNPYGNIFINVITYKISDTITAYDRHKTPFKYNLKDLYINILDIHRMYPLFRKMIQTNPDERCNIEYIIAECQAIILK